MGTLAITCAAADEVTAWCILVAVIAVVQAGTVTSALLTILLSVVYVFTMLAVVRPLLQRLGARYANADNLNRAFAVVAFSVLFLSAFTTEAIGIHVLFGAFLAGVVMPAQAGKMLAAKIEDFSLVILLPLFFAYTGLKSQIGLLKDSSAWLICGLIILVAVAGKVVGSVAAAKFTGQSWSDSLAIGALMNTRGLMELIVLNIGYDLGVLSPTVFTMMVLMALVTTFMTSPALSAIQYFSGKRKLISVDPYRRGCNEFLIESGVTRPARPSYAIGMISVRRGGQHYVRCHYHRWRPSRLDDGILSVEGRDQESDFGRP